MKDRFFYGFIAGIIGCIFQSIVTWGFYALKIANLRFMDFSASLIYGQKATSFFESIFAELAVYFFQGVLGIGFAYMIPVISSRHYLFKGWVYGVVVWFLVIAIMIISRVPELSAIEPINAFSLFLGASVYGITLAMAAKKIVSMKKIN